MLSIKKLFFIFSILLSFAVHAEDELSGKLTVFHAGSLSVPLKQIVTQFRQLHPNLDVQLEAAGSIDSARKISELKRPCDVLASADYLVIDHILIPEYADWNIKFASNEMTLVYHKNSRRSEELTEANWFEILLDPKISFGRADPNADPCGYRAVLTMQLAERYYNKPGLAQAILQKETRFMRPKETDLLALLESSTIDYIFLYRSVAEQHGLKYLRLPDQINLKNSQLASHYATTQVELVGKTPNEKIVQKGEPMIYGLTIPKNSPNPKAATAFVKYVLTANQGMSVIEKLGQPSVVPSPCEQWDRLPSTLKPFALNPTRTELLQK